MSWRSVKTDPPEPSGMVMAQSRHGGRAYVQARFVRSQPETWINWMPVPDPPELPKPHQRALEMAAFAADAQETDEPWLRWQVRSKPKWRGYICNWQQADPEHMHFASDELEYRRHPDAPPVNWSLLKGVGNG